MDRNQAIAIVDEMLTDPNLKKHCLAVEAIMRALARHFEADEDEWGLVGLLHDADYEVTEKDPDRHMHVIVERVRAEGVSERIVQGILAHGGQAPLDNKLNASIFALRPPLRADYGLRAAPSAGVRPVSRPKGCSSASGKRPLPAAWTADDILTCEPNLSLPLAEFVTIGVGPVDGDAKVSATTGQES